jgi:hypothetical protein
MHEVATSRSRFTRARSGHSEYSETIVVTLIQNDAAVQWMKNGIIVVLRQGKHQRKPFRHAEEMRG